MWMYKQIIHTKNTRIHVCAWKGLKFRQYIYFTSNQFLQFTIHFGQYNYDLHQWQDKQGFLLRPRQYMDTTQKLHVCTCTCSKFVHLCEVHMVIFSPYIPLSHTTFLSLLQSSLPLPPSFLPPSHGCRSYRCCWTSTSWLIRCCLSTCLWTRGLPCSMRPTSLSPRLTDGSHSTSSGNFTTTSSLIFATTQLLTG